MTKQTIYPCPYDDCDKKYKTGYWLISHLLLKHNRKFSAIFGISLTIFGILLAITFQFYGPNIKYKWDEIVHKESTDIALTLISFYPLENNNSVYLDNLTKIIPFLNKQVSIGVIPPYHNKKRPFQSNIIDNNKNKTYCWFWAWDNVHRLLSPDELPKDLRKDHPEGMRHIPFTPPEISVIDDVKNDCPECLGQMIYAVVEGKKSMDKINFRICYGEEVEQTDFEQESTNCVRIKRNYLVEGETFLGYVYLKNKQDSVYYDAWDDAFFDAKGEYTSENVEFDIQKESVAHIVSGIVPNCRFPEQN